MNDHEKTRIAAAINQLRPDWPAASLRSLLDRPAISNRPRRDVAVALAWIACETTTQTPARVLESGPWWKAAHIEGSGAGGPKFHGWSEGDPRNVCGICGYDRAACTSRARTNGHDFVARADCLPPVDRGVIGAVRQNLPCGAEVIGGTRCRLPNGHPGDHEMHQAPTTHPAPTGATDDDTDRNETEETEDE